MKRAPQLAALFFGVACAVPQPVVTPERITSELCARIRCAAVVDARFRGTDGIRVEGTPTFRSIGAALASVPANNGQAATIFIRDGRYHEKLTVDRARVSLIGESRDRTIITYDAVADTPAPGGGTYGTRGSYTLRITAPDFRAENLTIENAFDYPSNYAKPDNDRSKIRNPQAVALMLDQGSDRAAFIDVRISGYQDTLFPNAGRSFFHRCEVSGNVDFIFGAGRAVFEECDIISRDRGSRTNNGYVTAPSTPLSQSHGFVFIRSRLKKESPQMARASVTLGRPWHPFADPNAIGSSVFIDTWMDDHVGDKGWDRMSSVDSTGTRIWYEPASARFFEYGTRGPGAVQSPTRRTLTAAQVAFYSIDRVLEGWAPRREPTVTPIKSGELSSDRSTEGRTLDQLFQGRFPGVEVYRVPSGGISIRIRGSSSLMESSEPLFVVDGQRIQSGTGGLLFLNPEDIARIEVLKDIGSIAAFGSQGANGVVLITTKKAR